MPKLDSLNTFPTKKSRAPWSMAESRFRAESVQEEPGAFSYQTSRGLAKTPGALSEEFKDAPS